MSKATWAFIQTLVIITAALLILTGCATIGRR